MAMTRHGPEIRRRSWAGSLRRAQASPAEHTPIPEPPLPRFSDTIAFASSSFSSCATGGPHAQPAQRQMYWVYRQTVPRSMKTGTHRRGQRLIPACAESTPQYTPRIGLTYSGVLNKRTRGGNDRSQDGDDGSENEGTGSCDTGADVYTI